MGGARGGSDTRVDGGPGGDGCDGRWGALEGDM